MKYFLVFLFPVMALCSETFYIKPKAYLDVLTGKMIESKIIGVTGNQITSISSTVSAHKKVINYDLYLVPGLIDCHTHIFFTQYKSDKDFEKALIREISLKDEFRTSRARKFLKEYLYSGFTSLCDLGNSGKFLDVQLRDQIKEDEFSPDLFVSGPGLATENAQFDSKATSAQVSNEYTIVDDKTPIESLLKYYSAKNVDILKIYIDNSPGVGTMNPLLVTKFLNSKYIRNFKKITFHALEPEAFKILSSLNKNVSFEHGNSPGWGTLKNKKQTYLTLTDLPKNILQEFDYYNQIFYTGQVLRAKEAYANGINLVFGSDFYFHKDDKDFDRGHYVLNSIEAWKDAGIPNNEILKAMTINAARSLKMQNSLGIIKVGAKANLIGLEANPLNDIQALKKIKLLMNKGKIISMPENKK